MEQNSPAVGAPVEPPVMPIAWRWNPMEGTQFAPHWHYTTVAPDCFSVFTYQPLYGLSAFDAKDRKISELRAALRELWRMQDPAAWDGQFAKEVAELCKA